MIYVTAIQLIGGVEHEHIERVRWRDPETKRSGEHKRALMVKWIRGGGVGRIENREGCFELGVVEDDPPYIRARAGGVWTDSLLALPRF